MNTKILPTGLPIAIIGAGPVGLAAASHLLQRGLAPLLLERGPAVGHAIRQWGHVRMFSPWQYNVDSAAAALLERAGWQRPDADAMPTGAELVERYLEPLAALPELKHNIRFNSRVIAVGRRDFDKVKTRGRNETPFELTIVDANGATELVEAAAVIDASGTWFRPNPMASGGIPAQGEQAHAQRVHYGIPDVLGSARQRYAGKRVLVIGSGHSALNALLDLDELRQDVPGTQVVWALRRENLASAFGGGSNDALPERGELGSRAQEAVNDGRIEVITPFRTRRLESSEAGALVITGLRGRELQTIEVDEVIVATGFRPDLDILREIRLGLDSWLESPLQLAPLIDPNEHSCGTVRPHGARELSHPEQDFYIAGMKSYGRAPTFLLATGHEQVRSIAAALVGDWEAAERVELELPETGVCSIGPRTSATTAATPETACCAPAPVVEKTASSCCGTSKPVPEKAVASACCG